MNLIIHPDFPSELIPPRQVEVWLPPSYNHEKGRSYPVLYMHDGQNVFNEQTAYTGVTWGVDEALTKLITTQKVSEIIVVAVWNNPQHRWQEYLPQRPYQSPKPILPQEQSQQLHGPIYSDNYLRFLAIELKPFIDQTYRTKLDKQNTMIMGSSMGGLISLYALCEYPHLFGAAACISTHWPPVTEVIADYLTRSLPTLNQHKLYFDYGTETLDSLYEPHQKKIDQLMRENHFQHDQNWLTMRFDGADHSESAWRQRVHIPLQFLLSSDQ